MKKKEIIKKNYDYTKIIKKGRKVSNNYYSIYYITNNTNHYGISIPTKIGNAVVRNKIKRQIKNIIDNYKKNLQINNDYVIIVKKSILELNFKEKEKEFINLIKKIGDKDEKK